MSRWSRDTGTERGRRRQKDRREEEQQRRAKQREAKEGRAKKKEEKDRNDHQKLQREKVLWRFLGCHVFQPSCRHGKSRSTKPPDMQCTEVGVDIASRRKAVRTRTLRKRKVNFQRSELTTVSSGEVPRTRCRACV